MRKRTKRAKKPKKINYNVDPSHFNNRDISWLHFNHRVLSEAADLNNPIIERLRFLIIFSSNLDEFIMKRVGRLKRQDEAGLFGHKSVDGKTPKEQLADIRSFLIKDLKWQNKIFYELKPELEKSGVFFYLLDELNNEEKKYCDDYFKEKIFPVLTPLSVDPGHPFPFISNLSFSLGLLLKNPLNEEVLFSRIKIPNVISHWIPLPQKDGDAPYRFVSVTSIIEQKLHYLYPGMEILKVAPFRVTRNADVEHKEDEADDLMLMVEEGLKERRLSECVRLEVYKKCDPYMLKFLKESLEIHEDDIYMMDYPLDFASYKTITDLDLPELKFKSWIPCTPRSFADEDVNIFNLVKNNDYLVHHPYESFSGTVEKFLAQAADDPNVLTIKMTLYRTGDNSPFIRNLIRAAENGKQVVCLVELQARFDEQRNIFWANKLEDAGIHVVYGIMGLKTHTKTLLVIRQEQGGEIKAYSHIGTGNYHSQTSNLYTDLGLFTSDPQICHEIVQVFNYLTGSSLKTDYQQVLVAPINMKSTFLKLIRDEIDLKKKGKKGLIIAKMNSLEDEVITEALYEASQAGVEVLLFVRGFCCLKAGIEGLSENIKVVSVIGRFLEHSRIFYFSRGNNDFRKGNFYIGSADWMHRNLHNRVELITPIKEMKLKEHLWEFLSVLKADHKQAWVLQKDGSYKKRRAKSEEKALGTHDEMMKRTLARDKNLGFS